MLPGRIAVVAVGVVAAAGLHRPSLPGSTTGRSTSSATRQVAASCRRSAGRSPAVLVGAVVGLVAPSRAARPGRAWVGVGRASDRRRRGARLGPRSPPIVFGGVTGSGTDLLVAALQQAGLRRLRPPSLQQGLLSDPIDKTITFFVVFTRPQHALAPVHRPGSRRASRPSGLDGRIDRRPERVTRSPPPRLRPRRGRRRTSPAEPDSPRSVTATRSARWRPFGAAAATRPAGGPHRRSRARRPRCAARPAGRLLRDLLVLLVPIAVSRRSCSTSYPAPGGPSSLAIGPFDGHRRRARLALGQIAGPHPGHLGRDHLFYLTTRPADLVLDLERRGLAPRVAFVALAAVAGRAGAWSSAPARSPPPSGRAALDTEGRIWRAISRRRCRSPGR